MGVNGGRACAYEQAQPKTPVKTQLANRAQGLPPGMAGARIRNAW